MNNINFLFSDIAAGVAHLHAINNKLANESGIAFFHINKPQQSLTGTEAIILNQKMNLHTAFNYTFNTKLSFRPELLQ